MVLSPERWPYLSGRVALFSRTDGTLRPEFTKVKADAKVINITSDRITYEKDGESFSIPYDTIFNAAGFKSSNELEDPLEGFYDNVTVIGDAVSPRKILNAVHEAYHAIRVME